MQSLYTLLEEVRKHLNEDVRIGGLDMSRMRRKADLDAQLEEKQQAILCGQITIPALHTDAEPDLDETKLEVDPLSPPMPSVEGSVTPQGAGADPVTDQEPAPAHPIAGLFNKAELKEIFSLPNAVAEYQDYPAYGSRRSGHTKYKVSRKHQDFYFLAKLAASIPGADLFLHNDGRSLTKNPLLPDMKPKGRLTYDLEFEKLAVEGRRNVVYAGKPARRNDLPGRVVFEYLHGYYLASNPQYMRTSYMKSKLGITFIRRVAAMYPGLNCPGQNKQTLIIGVQAYVLGNSPDPKPKPPAHRRKKKARAKGRKTAGKALGKSSGVGTANSSMKDMMTRIQKMGGVFQTTTRAGNKYVFLHFRKWTKRVNTAAHMKSALRVLTWVTQYDMTDRSVLEQVDGRDLKSIAAVYGVTKDIQTCSKKSLITRLLRFTKAYAKRQAK
jgi:hypothetical protein